MKISKKSLLQQDVVKTKDSIFYVFDTETTGLSPKKDRIIQISIVKACFKEKDCEELERFTTYIHPGEDFLPLSDIIVDITKITTETIREKGVSEDVALKQIQEFLGESPILLGWNVGFDCRFLRELYQRHGKELHMECAIDVLKIARAYIPKDAVENYKLESIARYFCIDGIDFHDAGNDAYATMLVFSLLAPDMFHAAENQKKEEKELIRPVTYKISYWGHAFSKKQFYKRIYFYTNVGNFYYDLYTDNFESKEVDLEKIDLNYMRNFLFWATEKSPETIQEFKETIEFV